MRARRYPRRKADIHVPVPTATEYGIGPVVLGLPCVIGAGGVNRQLVLPMSAAEQQILQHSAVILDQAYRSLTVGGTTRERNSQSPPYRNR
jgi:malate/lactate dehydrogenase